MLKTSKKITGNTSQVHQIVLLSTPMIWSMFVPAGH